MRNGKLGWLAGLPIILLMGGGAHAQNVAVGSVAGVSPGSTVTLPVTINTNSQSIGGMNMRLAYPQADLVGPAIAVDASAIVNGHMLFQNEPVSGDLRTVVYNNATTTAFTGSGSVHGVQVRLRSTLPNGRVLTFTPQSGSALSSITGTVLANAGSFTPGTISVSTPFPIDQTFATATQGWTATPATATEVPWLFGATETTLINGSGLGIRNADGFRTTGFWLSPEGGVPFYDEQNLLIASFRVSSNSATPVPGAWVRFRGTAIQPSPGDSPEVVTQKISSQATLPEYQIVRAQPQRNGAASPHLLPTSAGRTYRFPVALDAPPSVVWPFKRFAFDQIVFEEGVSSDLTYILEDFEVLRYDMAQVNANLAVLQESIPFLGTFRPAGDVIPVGTLFRPDSMPFSQYRQPAGKSVSASALTYTYDGNNDLIYSYIDTGDFNGTTLVSLYDAVRVAANTLYLLEFHVSSTMPNAFSSPNSRFRVNLWQTGESWMVSCFSQGNAQTTASAGNPRVVKLWFIPSAEAATADQGSGSHLSISYDAYNFYTLDPDTAGVGAISVDKIRLSAVPLSALTPIEPMAP